jgi:hypothetical protein
MIDDPNRRHKGGGIIFVVLRAHVGWVRVGPIGFCFLVEGVTPFENA